MEGVGLRGSQSSWRFRGSCCVPAVLTPPSMVPAWGIRRFLYHAKQWAQSDFVLGIPSCGCILCNTAILIYCSLDVSLLRFCCALPGTSGLHFTGFCSSCVPVVPQGMPSGGGLSVVSGRALSRLETRCLQGGEALGCCWSEGLCSCRQPLSAWLKHPGVKGTGTLCSRAVGSCCWEGRWLGRMFGYVGKGLCDRTRAANLWHCHCGLPGWL